MASLRLAALVASPLFVLACAAPTSDATGSDESNVDTSGCSGQDTTQSAGPLDVRASRPPRKSCWNVSSGGVSVTYTWFQQNEANPQKNDIGFWLSLNGADVYTKAAAYRCEEQPRGGMGHDTTNERTYRCTATQSFDFGRFDKLLPNAYSEAGARSAWDVQVAVSLDDAGNWDSLGGQNYRFRF